MNNPLLLLENISFSYSNENVLSNLNLLLNRDEKIALIGDNGCGKSTLFNIITGLYSYSGSIKFNNNLCFDKNSFDVLRRSTGYLLQNSDEQLFCSTVIDDVAFAPLNYGLSYEQSYCLAEEKLKLCQILHLAKKHPYELSAGQKKMVAFAGILAQEPLLLLLDEPSNMLDLNMKELMLSIIKSLSVSLLVISHDFNFISSCCNRFINLDKGKLRDVNIKDFWLEQSQFMNSLK